MRGVATDDSQASIGKWPDTILRNLDLDFHDDPFPATGKSNVEQFFNKWYQDNKCVCCVCRSLRTTGIFKSAGLIKDYMIKNGPFDGSWFFAVFVGSFSMCGYSRNAKTSLMKKLIEDSD